MELPPPQLRLRDVDPSQNLTDKDWLATQWSMNVKKRENDLSAGMALNCFERCATINTNKRLFRLIKLDQIQQYHKQKGTGLNVCPVDIY